MPYTEVDAQQITHAVTFKFAVINVAALAVDSVLVSAVSGKKIRVLSYAMGLQAVGTALFESGGSAALTGTLGLTANVPYSFSGNYWAPAFETAAGATLTLTVTGVGAGAFGHLCYIEV